MNDDALTGLSKREREVLDLLARGCTNVQIAETLGITFATAKWHVSQVISKLGVNSREEAAASWSRERSLAGWGRRLLQGMAVSVALKAGVAAGVAAVVVAGSFAAVQIVAGPAGGSEPVAPASVETATATPTPTPAPPALSGRPEACPTSAPATGRFKDGLLCHYSNYPEVVAQDRGGCDLAGAGLGWYPHIDLSDCTLDGARFSMLNDARLAGASAVGASFRFGSLANADLSRADLRGADFTGAIASFVDFRGANLEGATMTDAIVGGSLWAKAICPDGTPADDNGGTCVGTAGLEEPPGTRAQGRAQDLPGARVTAD